MFGGIATEHGLRSQHLDQAAQSTHEGDLAGLAVFMWFPSSQFGQQLHFGPLKGDAHVVEKASCDPSQRHQSLKGLVLAT